MDDDIRAAVQRLQNAERAGDQATRAAAFADLAKLLDQLPRDERGLEWPALPADAAERTALLQDVRVMFDWWNHRVIELAVAAPVPPLIAEKTAAAIRVTPRVRRYLPQRAQQFLEMAVSSLASGNQPEWQRFAAEQTAILMHQLETRLRDSLEPAAARNKSMSESAGESEWLGPFTVKRLAGLTSDSERTVRNKLKDGRYRHRSEGRGKLYIDATTMPPDAAERWRDSKRQTKRQ